ncbi:hypothetical protein Y1Q_0002178 [Alligator mississippiensis]|uniref:Uncharacterized protein n=1 Tax=Alligator mississippiensis TaxID=8496 RepID=A0A151MPT9_ALLMI|nr:hypothetical protein Y1Q_0002178 [Alligator mississippiensis]
MIEQRGGKATGPGLGPPYSLQVIVAVAQGINLSPEPPLEQGQHPKPAEQGSNARQKLAQRLGPKPELQGSQKCHGAKEARLPPPERRGKKESVPALFQMHSAVTEQSQGQLSCSLIKPGSGQMQALRKKERKKIAY